MHLYLTTFLNHAFKIILLMFLTFFGACSTESDDPIKEESTISGLNDTGLTLYSQSFPSRATARLSTDPEPIALTITPDTNAPGQDADKGSDTNPENSDNDGSNGFRFTKLDNEGNALLNQATSYSDEKWQCVRDDNTGLIWEVKTQSGLQHFGNQFTWYEPDENINGGNAGEIGDNTPCFNDLEFCNTNAYITEINALNNGKGLCGSNSWRLPLREELRSIIDYSVTDGPMIDTSFFPNANPEDTWTSQTAYYNNQDGSQAWEMHFHTGESDAHNKNSVNVVVRLVH